ncbi:hypothetical protein PRIPAC_89897 [Pristionchus pacificus]|uniref:Uncharacterized protein n=1 Tax=Pristionchus pacificus TaxID=54126 RepID=A0A2A6B8J0_PRIPA|nr:hypothetical protein PRIPAC_89897 [Pristionchus pacificus]|eukprot:PDM62200.1 hypothetical protein PRIPAC_51642 [Pristionchus pacificus]
MVIFTEDDQKYVHSCGCHVRRLPKVVTNVNCAIMTLIVLMVLYNPRSFNWLIFSSIIATGASAYSVYNELRYGIIGYLAALVLFCSNEVYQLFSHPVYQNWSPGLVTFTLLVVLALYLYQIWLFYCFQDFLRKKQTEVTLPMTRIPRNNGSPPAYEPFMTQNVVHTRKVSFVM